MDGQQTIREALQMPFEKPSKDLFRHNAPSWMDLGHLWNARTRDSASGYPLEVMVKPTDDWKSEKLIPYILRGRNRAALFRYLLLDPLM